MVKRKTQKNIKNIKNPEPVQGRARNIIKNRKGEYINTITNGCNRRVARYTNKNGSMKGLVRNRFSKKLYTISSPKPQTFVNKLNPLRNCP